MANKIDLKKASFLGFTDPESYRESLSLEQYSWMSKFIGVDHFTRPEALDLMNAFKANLEANGLSIKVPLPTVTGAKAAQAAINIGQKNEPLKFSASKSDPKEIIKDSLQPPTLKEEYSSLSQMILENTKLPITEEPVNQVVQQQLQFCQQIIKAFEIHLLESANSLNEDAVDALGFATAVSLGISFEDIAGFVQDSQALKEGALNRSEPETGFTSAVVQSWQDSFGTWYRNTPNKIGSLCVKKGTLINTTNGSKPIESLGKEDLIIVYDVEEGKFIESPLLSIYDNGIDTLYEITAGIYKLSCTGNHSLLIKRDEKPLYISIEEGLKVGDLLCTEEQETVPIKTILKKTGFHKTYNLEVQSKCHNYIANGIIVHNGQIKDTLYKEQGRVNHPNKAPKWWDGTPTHATEPPDSVQKVLDEFSEGFTTEESTGNLGPQFGNQAISNSWIGAAKEKDAGSAAKKLFADCIPCAARLSGLWEIDPLGDILQALMNWINSMLDKLRSLFNMLMSQEFWSDICALLGFFSFNCIPDLMSIVALLRAYIQQIIIGFYTLISGGFLLAIWGLLSNLFIPLFGGLGSVLDHYIQMIMAPINCIIGSILTQTQKFGGTKLTGLREEAWRAFSPDAYAFNWETGDVQTVTQPQTSAKWQKEYAEAAEKLAEASTRVDNLLKLGGEELQTGDGIYIDPYFNNQLKEATQDQLNAQAEIAKLLGQRAPSMQDEILRRRAALSKAFTSGTSQSAKERRSQGQKELDAEGWLIYVQQITNKSLYYAADVILEARNMINEKIDNLKNMLFEALHLKGLGSDLRLEGMEKLKRIMRLVMIILAIIDIVSSGKLECDEEDTPSETAVGSALYTISFKEIGKGLEDQFSPKNSFSQFMVVGDEDNDIGVLFAPNDIDIYTGGPKSITSFLQGNDVKISESDLPNLKFGTYVPFNNCLKVSKSEITQVNNWISDLIAKQEELGL